MDSEPNLDSTLKVIEVTAREIVDRISASNTEGVSNSISAMGDRKMSGNTAVKTRRTSSINSSGEINDGRRSSILNENSPSSSVGGGITPPQIVSGENSIVQQLLTSVQNWIIEANPHNVGKKGHSLSLTKGITTDMHWVYSIESYLRTLDWSSQIVLGQRFSSQLVLWLKHLFHFKNSEVETEYNSVLSHWEGTAGIVSLTQYVLHVKNPNLVITNSAEIEGNFPVIYCSDEYICQQIRFKVGLPANCVRIIESMSPDWVNILEQEILNDSKKKLVPVMLLLNIDVRNLEGGCRLAEKYKLWIHLYGANILSYFTKRPESEQIGHSFTIDLTKWLLSPAVPYLTLYKKLPKVDQAKIELCGLSGSDILSFAPWFLTQAIGWTKFLALVDEMIDRGKFILSTVQKFACIKIVPNWSTLSDGQVIISALTFRYQPPQNKQKDEEEYKGISDEHPSAQYVDTLNSWLFHIMERDLKDYLPVEFVFVEGYGWNILIDLFKSKKLNLNEREAITNIFENHMTVLQATVSQKLVFSRLVKSSPELEWVDHEKLWAGLGAVRYIPKFNRPQVNSEIGVQTSDGTGDSSTTIEPKSKPSASQKSTFDMKENVDHLNAKIVDKLKVIDTAFSLGESTHGDWCVQFGMVTLETDVAELVRLVVSNGEEIEASSEFLKQMSELVLQGIEKATLELKRESEEALWEEGILRRVPVVGTFVNWWSPRVESGVRGRALNLAQGKVESTENIYKYHMQVEAFSPSTSSTSVNHNSSSGSATK